MLQLSRMLCLDYEDSTRRSSSVRLFKCHYSGGSQEWKWISTRHQVTTDNRLCKVIGWLSGVEVDINPAPGYNR